MRWVSKLLALAATGAVGTNALESSIFTFPVDKQASKNPASDRVVSEDVARFILELRSKSSVASVLGKVETDTVDRLNQYVDGQVPLFASSDSQESTERNIIVFEGLEQDLDLNLRAGQENRITVSHTSSALVENTLESVAESDSKGRSCMYHGNTGKSQTKGAESAQECISMNPILSRGHGLFDRDLLSLVASVETWVSQDQKTAASRISFKARSDETKIITKSLDTVFQEFNDMSSEGKREITVVFSPRDESKNSRRVLERSENSWLGSSKAQNNVHRSAHGLPIHRNLAPVCHATNSSCAEATNNCSGHGTCYLKSGTDSEASGNCYACRCQQTVVRKSDGSTQKIQWGGPSCEKKDISSSFWLIAGVSVLLVLMVGSGIGMLFSMGQQELPSVISAGVGGPKTQG